MKRFTHGVAVGGRYVLDSLIASGGMGDVWRAQDTVLARVVAVKIMRPDTSAEPVFAQRFHEEALLTAGLSHHNIATLFDYGEHENLAYIVMELVDGHSLAVELRERGALDVARVRSIVGQMALGLNAAHEAGVVHRDVKPANVLLTSDGAVKLTDFGIARAAGSMGLTRTGEVLGTPHYLSPEQALGRPATAASDLYALGVVAHELLVGRRPFDKDTPIATALAHVTEPMPTLPATVPSDVVDIIGRCLSKDPAMRPSSAREVASDLGMSWVEIRLPRPGDGPGAHLAHQPHGIPGCEVACHGTGATHPRRPRRERALRRHRVDQQQHPGGGPGPSVGGLPAPGDVLLPARANRGRVPQRRGLLLPSLPRRLPVGRVDPGCRLLGMGPAPVCRGRPLDRRPALPPLTLGPFHPGWS